VGELRGERILTLQGQLLEGGIRASIRTICSVLGYKRSNVYYAPKQESKKADPSDLQLVKAIRSIIEPSLNTGHGGLPQCSGGNGTQY
jgi:hypothetical protein